MFKAEFSVHYYTTLIICVFKFLYPTNFPSACLKIEKDILKISTMMMDLSMCPCSSIIGCIYMYVFVVVQSLSRVQLFATPWTAACEVSLSFTISLSLLKLVSIESVMPSNQLILCHPLLLLSSVFPSIRVFSNELALHITWPKYWSFSISPSNEYSG